MNDKRTYYVKTNTGDFTNLLSDGSITLAFSQGLGEPEITTVESLARLVRPDYLMRVVMASSNQEDRNKAANACRLYLNLKAD